MTQISYFSSGALSHPVFEVDRVSKPDEPQRNGNQSGNVIYKLVVSGKRDGE